MTRQIVFFRAKESGKSYTKLLSLTDTHALKKKQNSLSQNRWRRGASPAYQRESSISPAYQGESSTALVNTHYGRGSGAEKREPSLDLSRRAFQAGRRRKNARKNTRPNDMPARTLTHSLRRGNKHTIMRARARGRGRQAAAILVSRPLRISTPTRACARLGKVFFFVEAGGGTVVFAGQMRGYGNMVVVDHGFDLKTVYAHLSRIYVDRGRHVQAGDVIAAVGQTGHATGPHLHYEVRVGAAPVDPMCYLDGAGRQARPLALTLGG